MEKQKGNYPQQRHVFLSEEKSQGFKEFTIKFKLILFLKAY